MTEHYDFDQDLREAEAMVKGLENYLKGDELYASVSGSAFAFGDMPALTVGALLMRVRRLHILHDRLTRSQRERLDSITTQYEGIRDAWRVHYDQKVLWEANSRLNAMHAYFADAAQTMDMAASAYRPEQLRRTIVQDILADMDTLHIRSADLDTKVREIDNRLSYIAVESTRFLWDPQLEPAYPQDAYWWLYRKPRTPRS